MPIRTTKKAKKPKKSFAWKMRSAECYAGELGISVSSAWKRLWPEDFKKK